MDLNFLHIVKKFIQQSAFQIEKTNGLTDSSAYSRHMHPVVVVGSGPVGATAALNLLHQGINVVMVDIGAESKEPSLSLLEAERLNLKLATGDSQPYDFNEFNVLLGDSRKWFTSKSKGGHSLIWGATWDSSSFGTDIEWKNALKNSTLLLQEHFTDLNSVKSNPSIKCICFDSILKKAERQNHSLNFEVKKSQLALNHSTCDLSGKCHSICKSNSIWSSLELIKRCEEFKNFSYQNNVYVDNVEVQEDHVVINTLQNSFFAQSILLAAGPIGNSLILLRSKFANEIRLSDNQMITIPVISFFRKKKHSGKFGLAGLVANGESPKGNHFHVQMYAHPETFYNRILLALPSYLRRLSRIALRVLIPRLFIAIVYLDSAISGKIILKMENTPTFSKLNFNQDSDDVIEIQRILSKKFRKLSLFPLWAFGKISEVGESYHVGATKSIRISRYGEIDGIQRIKILGSLSLSEVKPGPITSHSMAQALLATNHWQED